MTARDGALRRLKALARHIAAVVGMQQPGQRQSRALLVQAIGYVPKVIALIFIGRYLPTRDVAIYGVAVAATMVLETALPFAAFLVRESAGRDGPLPQRSRLAGILQIGIALAIALTVSTEPGVRLVAALTGDVLDPTATRLVAGLLMSGATLGVIRAVHQARLAHDRATAVAVTADSLWVVPVLGVWFAAGIATVELVLMSQLGLSLMVIAFNRKTLRSLVASSAGTSDGRDTGNDLSVILRYSLPLIALSGSFVLLNAADRVVLGRYVSQVELAKYAYMYAGFGVVAGLVGVVHRIREASTSTLANAGEWSHVHALLAHTRKVTVFAFVGAGLLAVALGPTASEAVLGRQLLPSGSVIAITSLALALHWLRRVQQLRFKVAYLTSGIGWREVVITALYIPALHFGASSAGLIGAALAFLGAAVVGMLLYVAGPSGLALHNAPDATP